MKKIFVVFVTEFDGKYYATADTIKTGENLLSYCNRYHAITAHLCETRAEAEATAAAWNQTFINNGTSIL